MEEREFEWDDVIEKESGEFVLLPEGDYNFVVEEFNRAHHAGSDKLPPCKKAILTLRIEAPEGTARIQHHLFLHTKTEGLLSSFFSCIGQKKKGEPVRMNWQTVPGATGKVKVGIRTYYKNDGSKGEANEIKKFYPKEDGPEFKEGEF